MKSLVVAAALAVLAGCATPSGPQREVLGSLEVDGSNAFVNGSRAYNGASVRDGDVVTTGAATGVRVRLRDGGFVQLDENTDPVFRLFREGGCLLVKIATGQAFVDARRICIEDPNLVAVLNSKVNWRFDAARSVVTVLEGSASVERPAPVGLGQYDQYLVRERTPEGPPRRLTREEAEATARWTERFFRAAPPSLPRRPPAQVPRSQPPAQTPTPPPARPPTPPPSPPQRQPSGVLRFTPG
jgi:hypothetical protein